MNRRRQSKDKGIHAPARRLCFALVAACVAPLAACNAAPRPNTAVELPPGLPDAIEAVDARDASREFAELFCSVLEHVDDVADFWGPCERYIFGRGDIDTELDDIDTGYRVLIVPGILAQCASDQIKAFERSSRHLRQQHGMTVEYFDVPAVGSSAENGRRIAEHLEASMAGDPRRWIVVGHSKGAPDTLEGLVNDPDARAAVAALITVAGTIGGSPAADRFGDVVTRIITRFDTPCDAADAGGFDSLSTEHREHFIAETDWPVVPTYAIVGIADEENTSKVNQITWDLLSELSPYQDGQVLAEDGIAPRATFLAAAYADHWAIAMPFDFLNNDWINEFIDKNRYPREALLEAALRFVIRDLARSP